MFASPLFHKCGYCGCVNQNAFVIDHHHGAMICTQCGAEITSFQMLLPTFNDLQTHNAQQSSYCIQTVYSSSRVAAPTQPPPPQPATAQPPPLQQKASPKIKDVQRSINFLANVFHLDDVFVTKSLDLYNRYSSNIAATNHFVKPDALAASIIWITTENTMSLTFKELGKALGLEPKKVSKTIKLVQSAIHPQDQKQKQENQRRYLSHENEVLSMNIYCIPRIAESFQMSYKHERLVHKIVEYIDLNELIHGLNPLSILSVGFFFVLTLTSKKKLTSNRLKAIYEMISEKLLIAISTIKKSLKDVKPTIYLLIQQDIEEKKFHELDNLL